MFETLNEKQKVVDLKKDKIMENLTKDLFNGSGDRSIMDIAAHLWEKDRYHAARTCYGFMRTIDDLVDNRKAVSLIIPEVERQQISARITTILGAVKGDISGDHGQMQLLKTLKTYLIPVKPWQSFVTSMLHDLHNNGFPTLKAFLDYAEGACVAPASIFLHFCGITRHNGGYHTPGFDITEAARPIAIFSYLVHIIRDFRKDRNNNLNYFADDMIAANKLCHEDLKQVANGNEISPGFRDLIAEYCKLIEQYRLKARESIDSISTFLEPRYHLSLEIVFNLYIQIADRIDVENGTFSSEELNPSPQEVKECVELTISKFGPIFKYSKD